LHFAQKFSLTPFLHGLNDQAADGEEFAKAKKKLIDNLEDYDLLLRRHLLEEENLVVPMLLDLIPAEFDEHYNTRSDELKEIMKKRSKAKTSDTSRESKWTWVLKTFEITCWFLIFDSLFL